MKSVIILGKVVNLANAKISVEDHNFSGEEFNPSAVQVDVIIRGLTICFQTSSTLDCGGISSQLSINEESGSYQALLKYMQRHFMIDPKQDEQEQVYSVGDLICDELELQGQYDDYIADYGSWDTGNGMDANSESFTAS